MSNKTSNEDIRTLLKSTGSGAGLAVSLLSFESSHIGYLSMRETAAPDGFFTGKSLKAKQGPGI
jgi:hypothetical protein